MLIRCYCFSFLAHETDIPHLALLFKWCERIITDMIVETCGIISEVLRPIELPRLREKDFLRIAEGFERFRRVPNCIGCIDGKRIQIVAHSSIIIQVVCWWLCATRIIDLHWWALGSESDGGTFARTKFGNRLKLGTLGVPQLVCNLLGAVALQWSTFCAP